MAEEEVPVSIALLPHDAKGFVRLLRRGVVEAKKYFNTNRIELVDWVRRESVSDA